MRFNSNVMHNLCKNEIIAIVPIFMATAVYDVYILVNITVHMHLHMLQSVAVYKGFMMQIIFKSCSSGEHIV